MIKSIFFCCVYLIFFGISSGSPSSVRAIARSIVALEGQSVNLRCIPKPITTALRWTFGGESLSGGLKFKLGRLDQTLTINNLTMEDSGEYDCHVVGGDDVTATTDLIVKAVDCLPSIAGGLIWDGQSANRTSVRRCTDLHSVFNSGLTVSRKCNESGMWEDVDFSDCTMKPSMNREVIVDQAELPDMNQMDITSYESMVFNDLSDSSYEVVDNYTITLPSTPPRSTVSVAVVVSVTRSNVDDVLFLSIESSGGYIIYVPLTSTHNRIILSPHSWCYCGNRFLLTKVPVCIGPGVPPCVMTSNGYECKSPIYAGNGIMCGLDSDGDGYPDDNLPCAKINKYCEKDVCSTVYSDGVNDCTVCDMCPPSEPTSMPCLNATDTDLVTCTTPEVPVHDDGGFEPSKACKSELDRTWHIYWPETTVGSQAVTRCSGADSIGFVTRNCSEDGNWEEVQDITNCHSAELSILQDDSRQLNKYYFSGDEIDSTQYLSLLNSSSVSRDLRSRTDNSSIPLVPQDLNVANNILHTMISLLGYEETEDVSTVAKDLSSTISNLLNASNMVTYEFVNNDQDKDKPNEAESLFKNIESFASTFRSILELYQLHNVSFSDQNFDIDFELLSTFDLHSTGGIEFATENSKIFIPNAAIREQMNSEGMQVPIVNYAAQNLASVLPESSLGNATFIFNEVISSQISSQPVSLPPDGYVTLTFNVNYSADESEPTCVFWDSTLKNGNNTGGWSEEGVFLDVENTNSSTITCVTKHLTNFALLFRGAKKEPTIVTVPESPSNSSNNTSLTNSTTTNQTIPGTSADDEALSIVSYIGCGISIICLLTTIIIIVLFRKSAFKPMQNMIHVNLSLALLLSLILFVSGIETANENRAACILVTVLLHYFFLATFSWMLCEGIIIYVLLVKVFYEGFFKKFPFYFLVGWGLPIPIVAITAGISHDHYGIYTICWLPTEKGIIWAFISPVIFVIVCNSVILALAIYAIFTASRRKVKNHQMTEITAAKKLIRAAIFLLPTLGVTWIFGVLAVNSEHVAFAWIFTILNSVEGLFIFVFYILQNDKFIETMSSYLGIQNRKRTGSSAVKLTSINKHKTICQSATIETTVDTQKSDFRRSITDVDVEISAGSNNSKMPTEETKLH